MKIKKIIFSAFLLFGCLVAANNGENSPVSAFAAEEQVSVTIHYKKADGTSAADDAVVSGKANTTYSVTSPTVSGLIATKPVVEGVFKTNTEITVLMDTYDTYTTSTVASTDFVEEDGYYYIDSAADLLAFKDACTKAYTDAGAANLNIFKDKTIKLRTSIDWDNQTFLPLCGEANYKKSVGGRLQAFAGTFDGGNHIIANMKFSNTSQFYYGFFSALNSATIKDFNMHADYTLRDRFGGFAYTTHGATTFDNVHVFGNYSVGSTSAGNGLSGGFTGLSYDTTTIKNSSFVGKLFVANRSGHTYVGGLVGQNYGVANISNTLVSLASGSQFKGANSGGMIGAINVAGKTTSIKDSTVILNSVSTVSNSGGVIGNIVAGHLSVDGVEVYGSINPTAGKVGGVLGYSGTTSSTYEIKNSTNYASVIATGTDTCYGGIVGNNQTNGANFSITNCVNYGEISSPSTSAGGINGWVASSTITNCTNYGKVSAVGVQAGGIVGGGTANIFSDCTNYGTIYSPAGTAAGISANGASATYVNCTNYGDVSGDAGKVGGIAGNGATATYTDCVNEGNVTGVGNVGGIAGSGTSSTYTRCINNGTVTSTGSGTGGITGTGSKSHLIDCWNHGTVTATSGSTGGLVGTLNESSSVTGGGNDGNVISEGAGNVGGIAGWNGINSTIDLSTTTIGGTVTGGEGSSVSMVAGYTNNIVVTKYVNGVIVDYDFYVPGTAYTPSTDRISEYGDLVWYTDETLTTLFVDGAVVGTTGTNSGNTLNYSIYASTAHSAVYNQLLSDIVNADTCTDYVDYEGFVDRVNDLSEEEKEAILATVFVDANGNECSVGNKLAYMETLANVETPALNLNILMNNKGISPLVITVILALISIVAYYFIGKKRYAHN